MCSSENTIPALRQWPKRVGNGAAVVGDVLFVITHRRPTRLVVRLLIVSRGARPVVCAPPAVSASNLVLGDGPTQRPGHAARLSGTWRPSSHAPLTLFSLSSSILSPWAAPAFLSWGQRGGRKKGTGWQKTRAGASLSEVDPPPISQ